MNETNDIVKTSLARRLFSGIKDFLKGAFHVVEAAVVLPASRILLGKQAFSDAMKRAEIKNEEKILRRNTPQRKEDREKDEQIKNSKEKGTKTKAEKENPVNKDKKENTPYFVFRNNLLHKLKEHFPTCHFEPINDSMEEENISFEVLSKSENKRTFGRVSVSDLYKQGKSIDEIVKGFEKVIQRTSVKDMSFHRYMEELSNVLKENGLTLEAEEHAKSESYVFVSGNGTQGAYDIRECYENGMDVLTLSENIVKDMTPEREDNYYQFKRKFLEQLKEEFPDMEPCITYEKDGGAEVVKVYNKDGLALEGNLNEMYKDATNAKSENLLESLRNIRDTGVPFPSDDIIRPKKTKEEIKAEKGDYFQFKKNLIDSIKKELPLIEVTINYDGEGREYFKLEDKNGHLGSDSVSELYNCNKSTDEIVEKIVHNVEIKQSLRENIPFPDVETSLEGDGLPFPEAGVSEEEFVPEEEFTDFTEYHMGDDVLLDSSSSLDDAIENARTYTDELNYDAVTGLTNDEIEDARECGNDMSDYDLER